ncbi:MAG: PQQ-binding-like beta-propeller repeat protein [bacterium]|nr:PQQ-binding-like beta-propeller repeat protein [bacterium]
MKTSCNMTSQLILLALDALPAGQRMKVRSHVNKCPACRKKFARFIKARQHVDKPSGLVSPDRFALIYEQARGKEHHNYFITMIGFLKIQLAGFRLRPVLNLAGLLVIAGILFFSFYQPDSLIITKISNSVFIDQKPFFQDKKFRYSLKKKMDIRVKTLCQFQINTEKVILLEKDTRIEIQGKKAFEVTLLNGTLYGHVVKSASQKPLIIYAGPAVFKITGTTFAVQKTDGSIVLSVEEGTVKAVTGTNQYYIKGKESLFLTSEGVTRLSGQGAQVSFDMINEAQVIARFDSCLPFTVLSSQENCSIYRQKKNIGHTPYFELAPEKTYPKLLVTHPRYLPKEVDIRNSASDHPEPLNLIPRKGLSYTQIFNLNNKGINFKQFYSVKDHIMFLDKDGPIYTLNTATGTWETILDPGIFMNTVQFYRPQNRISSIGIWNKTFFIGYDNSQFYAYDYNKNKVSWGLSTGVLRQPVPVFYQDLVIVCNNKGLLQALDMATGDRKWQIQLDGAVSQTPVLNNSVLFLFTEKGTLYSISLTDARVNYSKELTDLNSNVPLLALGDNIIYTAGRSLIALQQGTGSMLWECSLPRSPESMNQGPMNSVILVVSGGQLYSIDASLGKINWNISLSASPVSPPYLWRNSDIILLLKDGITVLNQWGIELTSQYLPDIKTGLVSDSDIFICTGQDYLYRIKTTDIGLK